MHPRKGTAIPRRRKAVVPSFVECGDGLAAKVTDISEQKERKFNNLLGWTKSGTEAKTWRHRRVE
jgi:hypothetical protein